MPAAPEPTHVYILGFSDCVIKVGRTSNIETRFGNHRDSAKVRRAYIERTWVLETPHAKSAEHRLGALARDGRLERLTGEWYAGDVDPFIERVELHFRRVGLMPAEHYTWADIEALGVPRKAIDAALYQEDIRFYRQVPSGEALFFKEEIHDWISGPYFAEWMGVDWAPPTVRELLKT